MLPIKSWLGIGLVAFAFAAQAPDSAAQAKYPNRPIRILIPFAAGGGTDVVARIVGQRLSEQVGQPIIVEAKPGAGGAIAVNELMRSDPDGYTLLLTTSSHATLPALSKLPWHPSNDFVPVAAVYSYPFVFITNSANSSRFKTLGDFLAYARANPGKVNWGSSGLGGPQHLTGLQFIKLAKVEMVHVPYRGNAPMMQALVADEVQATFDTQTLVLPQMEAGKVVPLSIASERRSDKLPNVPTIREGGLDVAIQITNFVLAPKGTPAAIQSYLNKEVAAALGDAAVRARLESFGHTVPVPAENTIASVKQHIDGFHATYGTLVTEMGIKAD
jgi:tripartite-type tricarboxylate transporter receptor subunit TctC